MIFFQISNLSSSMQFHNSMELFSGKLKSYMKFHVIPWNSGVWKKKFHVIPWNFGSGQNSMEFHGTWGFVAQIPWNSMEPQVLFICCSKVPWNSGKSYMEHFHKNKFNEHWKDILNDILIRNEQCRKCIWYNANIDNKALVGGRDLQKRVLINLRKLIHGAKLNTIFIKIWNLKFHGILSKFKTQSIDDTNGSIQ